MESRGEDSFIWADRCGGLHMIFHLAAATGAHAHSSDSGWTWTLSKDADGESVECWSSGTACTTPFHTHDVWPRRVVRAMPKHKTHGEQGRTDAAAVTMRPAAKALAICTARNPVPPAPDVMTTVLLDPSGQGAPARARAW